MKKVYLMAVIFALLAGFATYMFASQIEKKTTIKDADTVEVYVAVQDIPENTEITDTMFSEDAPYFTLKSVVADYATPNYVSKQEDMVGMITNTDVYAGEQISTNHLKSVDADDVGLSFKLDDGMVAYSFSAGAINGVDGYITPGDLVDVIVYESDNGKTSTKVIYEDLKILKISSNSDNATADSSGSVIRSYGSLTVEVTEKQALKLMQIENDYNFKLVLKPRDASVNPPITHTTTTTVAE